MFEIKAKGRTGKENFVTCMRNLLAAKYGEQPVALGGVFNVVKGMVKLHVMVMRLIIASSTWHISALCVALKLLLSTHLQPSSMFFFLLNSTLFSLSVSHKC